MVNSTASVASLLSNIYSTNNSALSDSLSRLASGKRVQNPGDDFAGFVRASGLNTDVAGYNLIKQDLQDAKALVSYAKGVGNDVAEDLQRMKELKDLYDKTPTSDPDRQNGYKAEYDAIVDRIGNTTSNSYYDDVQVYASGGAGLKQVDLNSDNASVEMNIAATAVGATTGLTNIANAASTDMDNSIHNAQTYVAELESYSKEIDRSLKLTDTVIAGKTATVSAIVNVDEMKEITNVTNMQVRQQATVSMMAQANSTQAGIARLFM